jgi:site-specific DNA-methyltransferase (adenine-specific)
MKPISVVTNEDCMQMMARYPDKYFELAIVDPPYGIGEGNKKNKTRSSYTGFGDSKKWVNAKDYGGGEWDFMPPDEKYFSELFRISKNQIIWGANHFLGLKSSCWIVWDKDNGGCDQADCELAWTSFKTAVRKFTWKWQGLLQQNMKNKEERVHPTQKPVALYKWLLKNYAKEGDKILDTHLGSGSSRIAAYIMGFDFYGCEIDKDYFEAQEKRFKQQTAQQSLFNYEKSA